MTAEPVPAAESVAEKPHCHAGSDGDCWWADCPQEANNRANYQSWCPLAHDPKDLDYWVGE
jgi:hypothetical protein